MSDSKSLDIQIPEKLAFFLTKRARFKLAYGGRGSGKSWAAAIAVIIRCYTKETRVLCTRELQNSIIDSVHRLLTNIIRDYHLTPFFTITHDTIRAYNGSEIIFKGIRNNIGAIKSFEGVDICWIEEAAKVSANSWDILMPTIRKPGSEIFIIFNPEEKEDETYKRFVLNPPDAQVLDRKTGKMVDYFISTKVNYYDNPFFDCFDDTLRLQMEMDKKFNLEKYHNIWLGEPKERGDAQVFRNRWRVESFDTPDLDQLYQGRFFFGADWGFANDPTTMNRLFIKGKSLYIDWEANGVGIEINNIPALFDEVPESRGWKIYGDCARPETISYIRNQGFDIDSASKWSGSVEDGIAYLKGFEEIIIHPRCQNTIDEFRFYSYKVDPNTGEILPKIVDKYNHHIDGIRYALSEYITGNVSILDVLY